MPSEPTPEQRKLLDAAEKAYQEEKSKKQKVDINLKVDNPSAERLADIIEAERQGKTPESKDDIIDDLQNKLFFAAQKEIERKRKSLNAPPEIDTLEKLQGFEVAKKGESAGSAPMNPDYNSGTPSYDINTPLAKKVYPSYEAMLADLHDREAVFQGSPKGVEATRMLEALTRKFFEYHKEANSPVPVLQKPMPKLVSVNGLLVPEDPNFGDLQERNRIFRRRKMLERAERGSVQVKGEENQ